MNNTGGEYIALHVNMCFMGSSLIIKYAKKYGIPVRIFHSHNAGDMYPSRSLVRRGITEYEYKHVLRYSTNFIACSDWAGNYMFRGKPFHIIPNAIETEKYRFNQHIRDRKRKELAIGDRDFLIGFVGRLQYQKNPLFLIDLFKRVSLQIPDAKME